MANVVKKTEKDIIEEVINLVEDEFEGFCESKEDLEEYVTETAEELMELNDIDIDIDDIMKEVLKHVTFPRAMEICCPDCGEPNCVEC